MAVDLKNHPGLNPDYFSLMSDRRRAMIYNRGVESGSLIGQPLPVPPRPNKYVPHIGAKQRAKTAGFPDGAMDRSEERRGEMSLNRAIQKVRVR